MGVSIFASIRFVLIVGSVMSSVSLADLAFGVRTTPHSSYRSELPERFYGACPVVSAVMDEYIGPIVWPIRHPSGDVSEFELYYTERETNEGRERFIVATQGNLTDPVLLRVESSCVFGHILDGAKCDCGDQLRAALQRIHGHGSGMLIYALDEDARGHGVRAHFEMYVLRQHHEMDTEEVHKELELPVDARTYSYVGSITDHFNISEVVLMTNSPKRIEKLEDQGITVADRRPLEATVTQHNEQLLRAEKRELGYETGYHDHEHWIDRLRSKDVSGGKFLIVESYRESVAAGQLDELTAEALPVGDMFLVLYATQRPDIGTLDELRRAGLDKVVVLDSGECADLKTAEEEAELEVEHYEVR